VYAPQYVRAVLAAAGPLVAAVPVWSGAEAVVSTANGKVIRFPVDEVSVFSRYARGVRLMQLGAGDRVASVVVLMFYLYILNVVLLLGAQLHAIWSGGRDCQPPPLPRWMKRRGAGQGRGTDQR